MTKKGIIYLMTSAQGVVKIGKTGSKQYDERMRNLEENGYRNFNGFKRFFAIELADFDDKEKLIHKIFEKSRVGETECFAVNKNLLKELLLAFDGKIIYPESIAKEKEFDKVAKQERRQKRIHHKYPKSSFAEINIPIGAKLQFKQNENIEFEVVDGKTTVKDKNGKTWDKLSILIRHTKASLGTNTGSGAYQGFSYLKYKGKLLIDIQREKRSSYNLPKKSS
jgi:hypothetical protein